MTALRIPMKNDGRHWEKSARCFSLFTRNEALENALSRHVSQRKQKNGVIMGMTTITIKAGQQPTEEQTWTVLW